LLDIPQKRRVRKGSAVVERGSYPSISVVRDRECRSQTKGKYSFSVITVFLMSSHHAGVLYGNSVPSAQPLKSCG